MKPILLVAFLSFTAIQGYSQKNTIFGVFAGGGCATSNNYDVALSGGVDFAKGQSPRSFLGAELLYQQFSLLYDNEANSARHGTGTDGEIIRHKSAFIFVSPKFRYCVGRNLHTHFYFSPGIGFNMGGYDSVRRFSSVYSTGGFIRYDTTLDMSANINSMLIRIGLGCTQYFPIGSHWRFTLTEDFGFLPGSLTKTSDYTDVTRSSYSPSKLNPGYISIRLGISHTKFP